MTRYRIEDLHGSRDLTRYYLGRSAFLDALCMLHDALRVLDNPETMRPLPDLPTHTLPQAE